MWLLLLFAVELVAVLAFSGTFINPPPSTSSFYSPSSVAGSYINGSIVSVTCDSDLEWVALVMFPTSGDLTLQALAPNISNAGVFPWLVGNTTTYTEGYLAVFNPGDSNPLFWSDAFSIVVQSSSISASTTTSISAIPSTSTAPSASSTNSASSISAATQSLIVTQSATSSSGLSAGTAAGIGIGASFAFVFLIAMGILIGWKLHKNRSSPVGSRNKDTFGVEVEGNTRPVEMIS